MQSISIDLVAGSNLFPHKLVVCLVISCQECKARGCGGWVSLWRSCVFSFSTGVVCQGWKVRSGGVEGVLRPQAGRVLIGPWGEEKIFCACRGVSLWWTWSIYDNDWRKENCHGVKHGEYLYILSVEWYSQMNLSGNELEFWNFDIFIKHSQNLNYSIMSSLLLETLSNL